MSNRYVVTLRREVLQTAEVHVDAKSHADAKVKAEAMIGANQIIWNREPLVIYPCVAKLWKPTRAKKKSRR